MMQSQLAAACHLTLKVYIPTKTNNMQVSAISNFQGFFHFWQSLLKCSTKYTDGVGVDLYHAPSISVNIVVLDCINENNFFSRQLIDVF